jgi:hypothetical protein
VVSGRAVYKERKDNMKRSRRVLGRAAEAVSQAVIPMTLLVVFVLPIAAASQCSYTTLVDGEIYDLAGTQQGDEHFYQLVQPAGYWCAVAVRSEWRSVNPDILLYPEWSGVPPCVGGDLMCQCTLPSGQVDFIALDYTQLTPGTDHYPMITVEGGPGDCHVQWEDGAFELGGMDILRVFFGPTSFLVKVVNVYLTEGAVYRFTFDCEGTDVRMCLFDSGSGAWGSRVQAEFEVGCGQPYVEYTPPASRMYGLVIFNEGGTGGMFELGPILNTAVGSETWGAVKALYR